MASSCFGLAWSGISLVGGLGGVHFRTTDFDAELVARRVCHDHPAE